MSDKEDVPYRWIISILLGAILGGGITELFSEWANFDLWLFVLVTVSCLVTFAIIAYHVPNAVKATRQHAEKTQTMMEELLRQRAQIVPRESIYFVMAKVIREAKETVSVITYFMYDWESKRRTFLPASQEIPGLEDFYKAIYDCIERGTVKYLRVWQVPSGKHHQAYEVLLQNPNHKKEIELIEAASRQHPEKARFIIADQHTTASYILVDGKNLFFNVDFYDEKEGVWYSPYMIFIKDASENAFADLDSVIARLTLRADDWRKQTLEESSL